MVGFGAGQPSLPIKDAAIVCIQFTHMVYPLRSRKAEVAP
jgi:hypothetical protein